VDSLETLERYKAIVPDFGGFVKAQSRPLHASVRINTLKVERSRLLLRLDKAGVEYRVLEWYPLGLRLGLSERPGKMAEHALGYIHVQEVLSMVPPLILDPKPGEAVLDMCSSPGSKTSQIAQAMENRGLLVANEPSMIRLKPLRFNCERLGITNVVVTRYDGQSFPDYTFDRVLADVPCSSEGTARKDLKVLLRSGRNRSLDLQPLQVRLLKKALMLTHPGGTVVYSTCTYAPEENEAVVNQVLGLARLEKFSLPGLQSSPGLIEWNGETYSEDLKLCARYYPHQNDTGGFFVAKLIRL
jgi:NOL1/NOP2/sun family putative RNA methylase